MLAGRELLPRRRVKHHNSRRTSFRMGSRAGNWDTSSLNLRPFRVASSHSSLFYLFSLYHAFIHTNTLRYVISCHEAPNDSSIRCGAQGHRSTKDCQGLSGSSFRDLRIFSVTTKQMPPQMKPKMGSTA